MKFIISAVLGSLIAGCCTGCTGPFGFVVGSSEIHKLYNQRVAIENKQELEHYSQEDRAALEKTIATRRY